MYEANISSSCELYYLMISFKVGFQKNVLRFFKDSKGICDFIIPEVSILFTLFRFSMQFTTEYVACKCMHVFNITILHVYTFIFCC